MQQTKESTPMSKRICIVTPCLKGPINNGGIGTAIYYLSKHITQAQGFQLDILFTGDLMNGSCSEWVDFYKNEVGANLFYLERIESEVIPLMLDSYWINERSLKVHNWLKNRSYDQIHFQDYQANGFIAIQAKKAGQAYQSTYLTCTLHSSVEWMQSGNAIFPQKAFEEMVHVYMEHYCAANADAVISPTSYMLRWYAERGYPVKNGIVIQNLFDSLIKPKNPPKTIEEICLFGRLETRKGLEDFVQAIKKLAVEFGNAFPKVSFLGRQGLMSSGISPYEYIQEELKGTNIDYQIDSSKNAFEAIEYLRDGNKLAVVASKSDNLPYVVVECLQNGIPVMASNVGGIPELILSQEHLFESGPSGMVEKLRIALSMDWMTIKSGYDPDHARSEWSKILSCESVPTNERKYSAKDVTICIPYFNYPDYLPQLLKSLEEQSVQDFNVIVINDGSTKEEANSRFKELSSDYNKNKRYRFISRENKGISVTRNEAAELSETKLLVFMDSDNLAMPSMVEKMIQGINSSGMDCLTCYAEFFEEDKLENVHSIYTPVGPCIQAGLYYNIYGDANFIIKKESFSKVGGFNVDRSASFEDWEFLARFSLSGMKQDVIPEKLFRYRITASGFSRNTSRYGNFNRIVQTYKKFLPEWAGHLIYNTYTALRPDTLVGGNGNYVALGTNNHSIVQIKQSIISFFGLIMIDCSSENNKTEVNIKIPSVAYTLFVNLYARNASQKNANSKKICFESENGKCYVSIKLSSWISDKLIALRAFIDAAEVRKSKLFNEKWYYSRNNDVLQSGIDAAIHYARSGWREGRDPGPHFRTAYYLASRPDVKVAGMNPLIHFERYAKHELSKNKVQKN
jgi:glycosyltransferase involved in cell wall biosynthesis